MTRWLTTVSLVLHVALSLSASAFQTDDKPASTLTAPDPQFSPSGHYTGPLDLPHVVRFQALPFRMHLDPLIPGLTVVSKLDERYFPLWVRVLEEATDSEIQEVAALSLAQAADLKLADVQKSGPTLIAVMKASKNDRVRFACARALALADVKSAEPELVKMAAEGADPERLAIEPALARWKSAAAAELWRARLQNPQTTGVSFRLAAEGLAAITDAASAPELTRVVSSLTENYSKRTSAARALAVLVPDQAYAMTEPLFKTDVVNRLLGLALLDSVKPEAMRLAATYCEDASDGVASVAWQQVFHRQPEVLVKYLSSGCLHRDAQVRMSAARTIRLYPDAERTAWLHRQLSDVHIEVRNVARQMLVLIAGEHPELKEQIIAQAGDMLKPDSSDWQGIEQSLLILGQLYSTKFSTPCFALLDYPRDEVGVAAAWLIQLFPDESIRDQVRDYILHLEEQVAGGKVPVGDFFLRETMLLNYAGLLRIKDLQPLYEKQFSKSAAGTHEKRAAALWALALLFERNPVPELAAKYEERIKDRNSMPPESFPVRRMAVLSLGLLRAEASSKVVFESYEIDSQESSVIASTARWVLPLLGQPMPPDFAPVVMGVGGWRLNPAGGR